MLPDIIIPILLFIVAFLYASVGHGGASGYIAVLTLFSIPKLLYKPVVLVMNTIIAGIAFIQFYRAGHFKWSLAWPFLITSIPCAFLGSKHVVSDSLYNILLGAALLFPMVRLMVISAKDSSKTKPLKLLPAFFWGALIGFVSGFLNIGGGIFLSPVIVLMGWGNTKDAAAVSSLFIVCNSLAGLAADKAINIHFTGTTYTWLIAAVVGGLAGSYLGSRRFNLITVRYILSAVLCIAAVKLIFS